METRLASLKPLYTLLLGLLVALLALPGTVHAASATAGDLRGVVVDDADLAIPGVTVVAESPNLIGGAQQRQTDAEGNFSFSDLPPGIYSLTASKSGFGQVKKTQIQVSIGRTTTVTIQMRVGQETVVIEEERKTVDTSTASKGDTLTKDFLSRIPSGRTYQDVVSNVAGVIGGGNPNVAGASYNENTFLLDGVNVTDPVTGTFSLNFNFDAIEEIQVITGGYDPEYGESLGGVISVVTKSGGNTLEVINNGYYLNGNWGPKIDARYSADGYQIAPTGFDSTAQTVQIGSTVSGPVVKDRVWFLGSYEYDRTLYSNVGVELPRDYDAHYFFGKLTTQPSSEHRFTFQFSTNPTSIDNQNQSLYVEPEAQERQAQGGWLGAFKWNWFISPEANLETSVSYQKVMIDVHGVPCTHDRKLGYSPCAPDEEENSLDFETPGHWGVGGGAYDSVNYPMYYFDDRYSAEAETKLSLLQVDFLGKHDIKGGVGFDHVLWDQVQGYNGNLVFADWYYEYFNPNTLQNYYWGELSGPYQYRSTGVHVDGFLQDVYKPVKNLTFRYGLRYDRAIQNNDAGEPVVNVGVLGPRFYAVWDPWADEKTKFYGGYGRFNDTGRLSIASYLSQSNLGVKYFYGEVANNNVSTLEWNAADYDTANTIQVFSNTAAPHSDEFTLGGQRELIPNLAATVEFTGKFTRNIYTFDELNVIYDEDGYSYIGNEYGNLDLYYRLRTPEIALRDYYQTDFRLERVWSDRWLMSATYSYVVSKGRTQNSLTGTLANPSQVELYYGNLSTDIRHQGKLAFAWDIPNDPWTTSVGFQGYAYSGSPITRYYYSVGDSVNTYGSYSILKQRLGTYDRTNGIWQLSFLLKQAIPVDKGKLAATLQLDNITNNRYPLIYYSYYVSAENRYIIYYRQDPITAQVGVTYEF